MYIKNTIENFSLVKGINVQSFSIGDVTAVLLDDGSVQLLPTNNDSSKMAYNKNGGTPFVYNFSTREKKIDLSSNIKSISMGLYAGGALTKYGSLKLWGQHNKGGLFKVFRRDVGESYDFINFNNNIIEFKMVGTNGIAIRKNSNKYEIIVWGFFQTLL